MKKALAMALGAVLAAGSAAPASAASQVNLSGFYGVHYVMNGNLGYTSGNNLNESFFENRFNVDVRFRATDEVTVVWRFRAPRGARWSSTDTNTANGQRAVSSHFYYGQVVQDWGTVRVGRLPFVLVNQFGLFTLGWTPTLDDQFTRINPFDKATEADSIQYTKTWDNGFGLTATYSKMQDGYYGSAWTEEIGGDHDSDRFQTQGTYRWESGAAALNLMYLRDAASNGANSARYGGKLDKSAVWYINPAIAQSWGAFSVHAEAMFAAGTVELIGEEDIDAEGQGFYLDFDYNYGPGRVNLAGWWVSGNDVEDLDNDDFKDKSQAKIDGNFYPLVVAYSPVGAYYSGVAANGTSHDAARDGLGGAIGVANNGASFLRQNGSYANIALNDSTIGGGINAGGQIPGSAVFERDGDSFDKDFFNNGQSNHWALMLSGQYAFTDEITFNYALAYMALNNPNYKMVSRAVTADDGLNWGDYGYATQDKDLGWEIDLGVNVQLLDNLAFTSTVGYMFTGDAYKQLKGYRVTEVTPNTEYTVNAEWEDADDAYSWMNSLIFSF